MNINSNDFIKKSNVVSKQYVFNYKDIEKVIVDFCNTIKRNNLTPKGLCFYSIYNVPLDENMVTEFYMEVEEKIIYELDDLKYQSYFSIDNMISTCIYGDFYTKTEEAYYSLIKYMEKNQLIQSTPIFNVISGDRDLQYTFIKVGVK